MKKGETRQEVKKTNAPAGVKVTDWHGTGGATVKKGPSGWGRNEAEAKKNKDKK